MTPDLRPLRPRKHGAVTRCPGGEILAGSPPARRVNSSMPVRVDALNSRDPHPCQLVIRVDGLCLLRFAQAQASRALLPGQGASLLSGAVARNHDLG